VLIYELLCLRAVYGELFHRWTFEQFATGSVVVQRGRIREDTFVRAISTSKVVQGERERRKRRGSVRAVMSATGACVADQKWVATPYKGN
jgi:hypothetical protein